MVKINAPVEGYSNCSKAITQNYLRKIGDHHQTETLNSKANESHKTRLRKKKPENRTRKNCSSCVFKFKKSQSARARHLRVTPEFAALTHCNLITTFNYINLKSKSCVK